ncbi:ATP-grasp domain-containing protein [candidate division KSB1 bacterium]|nr:ATP-grasp domain-containing protein [candidate division KSB1 bacterium]
MAKTLLIVSGGIEAVPGIQRAKEMGLYIVVSDMDPNASGFEFSDDHIIASTYDINATVRAAKEYHKNKRSIDGVICIASDVPLTVSTVAEEFNLPGIPVETARLASDKLAMKKCFASAGIQIPWYSQIETVSDLKKIIEDRGLPLVIKPIDNRGARGVLRITNVDQAEWAFVHSLNYSPTLKLMVEEFLEGPQISTEAIIIDGVGYPIGFTDRNYEFIDRFAPYIIENGGGFPSHLDPTDQIAIADMSIKAGLAMGIKNGIAKGDMVLTDDGPKVIEIAARLSGGWFSTDQIPLGLGIDLIGSAIKLALGEKIDVKELIPQYHKGVAIRYFFPEPGIVKGIRHREKFNGVNWVNRLGLFVKPGDIVESVTNHTKRAGFVITTADTQDLAIQRALEVVNNVQIETGPVS